MSRRVIGLIPARGGSKRLAGKNLKSVGGVSLLARAMRCARECDVLTERVVSTDSDEIRAQAIRFQCPAEYRESVLHRPAELATDDASMVDVVLHACQSLSLADSDVVVLLQPTSPLRSVETIKRAVAMFGGNPVVSVSSVKLPEHAYSMQRGCLNEASVVTPNGCVYVVGVGYLRLYRSFVFGAQGLVVEGDEAIDVDTRDDWLRARVAAGEVLVADPYGNVLDDEPMSLPEITRAVATSFSTERIVA